MYFICNREYTTYVITCCCRLPGETAGYRDGVCQLCRHFTIPGLGWRLYGRAGPDSQTTTHPVLLGDAPCCYGHGQRLRHIPCLLCHVYGEPPVQKISDFDFNSSANHLQRRKMCIGLERMREAFTLANLKYIWKQ